MQLTYRTTSKLLQRVTLGTKGYLDLYPELANYEWDESGSMVDGDAFQRWTSASTLPP